MTCPLVLRVSRRRRLRQTWFLLLQPALQLVVAPRTITHLLFAPPTRLETLAIDHDVDGSGKYAPRHRPLFLIQVHHSSAHRFRELFAVGRVVRRPRHRSQYHDQRPMLAPLAGKISIAERPPPINFPARRMTYQNPAPQNGNHIYEEMPERCRHRACPSRGKNFCCGMTVIAAPHPHRSTRRPRVLCRSLRSREPFPSSSRHRRRLAKNRLALLAGLRPVPKHLAGPTPGRSREIDPYIHCRSTRQDYQTRSPARHSFRHPRHVRGEPIHIYFAFGART
ncbi:hypothetical protein D9611_001168 [Ephemerocybe angulata]|uniref:Uncharacterized protein n=1 Tax=Ephemerocybe angulata TaxID=980116 RepID=A0A8H5CKG6_9AGAR|nr:hypothetical protein D9611_001168 [Tulosesus angulatus]